jgi:hypothetical protein
MTITTSQFIAINTGVVANDGTGDDLRTAFTKVNDAFANIADVGFSSGNISVSGDIEVTGNITSGNLTATNLYGLIRTPTQSQITALGTLTGANISGVTRITNTTNALQFNSGALIVDGGMGIAKDVYIQGNLYVGNAIATSVDTLVTTSPLVFFDTIPAYPYNFDIGFYGQFTGAVGNVTQHTGFLRNDTDSKWHLFSNVTPAVVTTQMNLTSAKYDTLVLGNIELKSTATTAITNGGTTATGNIGASGATFNYGYFTNLTGTLQTAAQNNITSASALATVGTITTGRWSATFGNVSGANLTVLTAGNLIGTISSTVMGNSTAYIGTTAIALNRASAVQSLSGVSIDGAAGSVAASAITGTAFPATVTGSSLTTVGTLVSLSVTGNIRTGSNLIAAGGAASISTTTGALLVTGGAGVSGNIYAGGNIVAPTFIGNVTGNLTGTLLTASQTNITSVGTLGALSVTGNITAGNVGATNLTGTIRTAAQSAITSLGTLTGLTVSGTIAASANNTTNIGAVGTTFATVHATTFSGVSTTARYADLAENYLSDSEYGAGTVVVFGGNKEITTTQLFADTAVAGVISTNPAYLMNDALDGQPVALRGRVPVKVQGFTRKGDLLVTGNIPGVAVSVGRDGKYGQAVFAKALENKTTTDVGVIEAVII